MNARGSVAVLAGLMQRPDEPMPLSVSELESRIDSVLHRDLPTNVLLTDSAELYRLRNLSRYFYSAKSPPSTNIVAVAVIYLIDELYKNRIASLNVIFSDWSLYRSCDGHCIGHVTVIV